MHIKHREADQFLNRGLQGLFFFLFYGTDEGLIHERAYSLVKHYSSSFPNCERIDFDGDELAQHPHLLYEEAQSLGLFTEKKIIVISAKLKSFVVALENCLEDGQFDTPIIIKASALKTDHYLRKLFERHKKMAAIECYPDTAHDLSNLIRGSAQHHNYSITPDAIDHLIHSLGESRLSTRLELDKLYLYCHQSPTINLDDVLAISSDTSDPLIDELSASVFLRQHQNSLDHLQRLLSGGHDPTQIIGHLLRVSFVVLRTKIFMDNGENPESARLKASRSIGLFGRPQKIENYARQWTHQRLIKTISVFSDCINRIRLEPKLAETFTERAVLLISR
jgi:DNA polymerase-3 subunit delta